MAEQVTPAVKEQAPEAPARAILDLSDEAFLDRVVGPQAEKPEATPEKAEAKEDKPEKLVAKEVPAEEEEVVEEQPEAKEKPEEVVEEKKEAPKYDFQAFDGEGELEVPEDLSFTFTAVGKTRENVPLKKVIQLAQMGYYNHERELSVKEKEQQAVQVVQESTQLKATLDDALVRLRRVLTDREYAEELREKYEEYNSPESRADRAEREAREAKEQVHVTREAALVAQANQTYLAPAVESLIQENPLVPEYEVMGRFSSLVAPHLVNGRLPASKLPIVADMISGDLTYWVRAQQEDRADKEAEKAKALDGEKRKAALAKRQVARIVKPAGGPGPEKATQTAEPKSAKDWFAQRFLPAEK